MTQIIVFVLYFLLVFAIGYFSMKETKDEKDYWIAGGKLGWLVGGATLSATHTSAGTFIGTIGVIYATGWSFGWLVLSIPLAYWFVAAVLAPRFTEVKQLTLPAYIEWRYKSKTARAIAAVIILLSTVVYIQAQIMAGGLVANVVFGIDIELGMVIFTFILIGYTMVGGMIAVAYTDLLQLIIMVLGVIVAIPLALYHFDGLTNLLEYSTYFNAKMFSWDALPGTLIFTMGLAFFLGSVSTPEKLTRLYAMKDMSTIRRGILLTIVLVTFINLMVFVIGVAGSALFPLLPKADLLMPVVARTMLPSITGAIMLAAIGSAMMSTVDSLLLVAGSALSEDIYSVMIDRNATVKTKLRIARLAILVIGLVPLGLVLSGVGEGELIQFIVVLFSALMAASFFIPVVGGLYWKGATKQGAIAAMIAGVSICALWKLFGDKTIDPVLPGFVASAVLFVVVSLLTKVREAA